MKIIRIILTASLLSATIIAGYLIVHFQMKKTSVTSFEQCAAAGYPIQESFPEVCLTPDGKSFTKP